MSDVSVYRIHSDFLFPFDVQYTDMNPTDTSVREAYYLSSLLIARHCFLCKYNI
jgi:hypothetical protein